MEKVPYMLVLGAKEEEDNTVSVRLRDSGETLTMSLDEFMARVKKETEEKK